MKGEPCGLGSPCKDMAEWLCEGGLTVEHGRLYFDTTPVHGCVWCGRALPDAVLNSWNWKALMASPTPAATTRSTGPAWSDSHGYADNDPL